MFVICTKCRRHIRHSESSCPFCGAPKPEPSVRLGVGLAVALGVAATLGCSGESNNGGGETGGMGVNAYGPPPDPAARPRRAVRPHKAEVAT